MVGIIEGYRDVLLRGSAPGPELFTSGLVALTCFVIGFAYFKNVEPQFADII